MTVILVCAFEFEYSRDFRMNFNSSTDEIAYSSVFDIWIRWKMTFFLEYIQIQMCENCDHSKNFEYSEILW